MSERTLDAATGAAAGGRARRAAPAAAQSSLFNPRWWRLTSGLVVLAYVAGHIVNLALGNISVEAMQSGLKLATAVWRSAPGTIALYGALAIHAGLGFWALYERRMFRYRAKELPQLALGLLIPFMLINHIIVTRLDYALYGTNKGYSQELYTFWVASPFQGFNQALVLLLAWIHACIGLHLWLRLRRWYKPLAPALLVAAALIPTLGLMGFYQAGRTIRAAAVDFAWRSLNASPVELGTLAERQWLAGLRNELLVASALLVVAVLALRALRDWRERRGGVVTLTYPDRRAIRAPLGMSLLEASTRYEMPHAGVCGGRGRCGTCRVAVLAGEENLPPPGEVERAVLARIGSAQDSRLRIGCQVRPLGDVTIAPILPPHADPPYAFGARRVRSGREMRVVAMFVEFADLAEDAGGESAARHLFRVNRFLEAAVDAITRAGGAFNRLSGGGALAIFDAETDASRAARQAIDAAAMIGVNVEHLARLMGEGAPIPFVVGIDIGVATMGDLSIGDEVAYTAVGGVVRNAAAFCDLARAYGCEAVYGEALHRAAGLPEALIERRTTTATGLGRKIEVRCTPVAALFGALDALADAAIVGAGSQATLATLIPCRGASPSVFGQAR